MNRLQRTELAKQTLEIVERGRYTSPNGCLVEIHAAVQRCNEATKLFASEDLERLRHSVLAAPPTASETLIEVANETTLAGIARLGDSGNGIIAALNFASARNPGGGFISGSQAQEESLARSSSVYASLTEAMEFYDRHRASRSLLYSDAVILSPNCPVFRDDDGVLLDQPLLVGFITCAAPNAGAIAKNQPEELAAIPQVFRRRSECVLAVAAAHGYKRLVLGAWGCGVFGNDPRLVARAFAAHLQGAWAGRFERVVFSVLDNSPGLETFKAFQDEIER